MRDWDVIVVGAGAAGLSAAVSAAEDGARVLLFESEGEVGGSMLQAAGMFTAAGTSVQHALGIADSVERFFQHYMNLNQWRLMPGLIRTFCESAAPTFEWLIGLGMEVPTRLSSHAHMPGVCRAGVEDVWRGHVPVGEGYGVVELLNRVRQSLGGELVLRTRVENLLCEDGHVAGVRADGLDVRAGCVVVASGGLARDPELIAKYYPDALLAGEDLFVVAGRGVEATTSVSRSRSARN